MIRDPVVRFRSPMPMSAATAASQSSATAAETDSETLGWMKGFPPPENRTISFQNGSFRSFPELRWAWSNIRQLVPTVNVWRGAGPASVLPRQDHDIGASSSTTMDGRPMTFAKMLEETYADGIVVLHRGRLIYERYFGALKPHKPHIAMSVTNRSRACSPAFWSPRARSIRRRLSRSMCRS